jgi:hypothetical protein
LYRLTYRWRGQDSGIPVSSPEMFVQWLDEQGG